MEVNSPIPLIPIEEEANSDGLKDDLKDYVTIICDKCLKEIQSSLAGKDLSEREISLKAIKDRLKEGITHKEFVDKNKDRINETTDCQYKLRYHSDSISIRRRREKEIEKEVKENEEENKRKQRYIELAKDIINKGEVKEFIIKTAAKFHWGDEIEIIAIYYSALTTKIKNSTGMHMNAVGDIGIGKSDVQRTVAFLLPINRIKVGNISPKAIYYGEFPDGIVIFLDDTEISEDIAELMRKTTTQFHQKCEHYVVMKGEYIELIAPAEIVWWINFNFATSDEALNNRFIIFNVDESKERKEKIHDFITKREKEGRPAFYIDDEVEICRMIFDFLPLCRVKVPFDTQKYYEIKYDIGFRDRNIIMDMIKCSALINYKKRTAEKLTEILTIEANEDDFNTAKKLWNYLFGYSDNGENCKNGKSDNGKSKRDNLTKLERNIYQLLIANPEGFYVGDIALKLDKSIQNVSRALSNIKNKVSDVDHQEESVPIKDADGRLIKTIHKRRYLITGIDLTNIYNPPASSATEEEKNAADNIDNKYTQRTGAGIDKYSQRTRIK